MNEVQRTERVLELRSPLSVDHHRDSGLQVGCHQRCEHSGNRRPGVGNFTRQSTPNRRFLEIGGTEQPGQFTCKQRARFQRPRRDDKNEVFPSGAPIALAQEAREAIAPVIGRNRSGQELLLQLAVGQRSDCLEWANARTSRALVVLAVLVHRGGTVRRPQ
jgi:hypothetical protein